MPNFCVLTIGTVCGEQGVIVGLSWAIMANLEHNKEESVGSQRETSLLIWHEGGIGTIHLVLW